MKLSCFAVIVICFNVLASVLGICMPRIIEFEAKAKFADFGASALTEAYVDLNTRQKMPDIVLGTTLSLIGVYLGLGLLKRRAWARKGWLAVCLIWVALPAISQFTAPDLSLSGIVPILLRITILAVSCFVLLDSAVIREFDVSIPT